MLELENELLSKKIGTPGVARGLGGNRHENQVVTLEVKEEKRGLEKGERTHIEYDKRPCLFQCQPVCSIITLQIFSKVNKNKKRLRSELILGYTGKRTEFCIPSLNGV